MYFSEFIQDKNGQALNSQIRQVQEDQRLESQIQYEEQEQSEEQQELQEQQDLQESLEEQYEEQEQQVSIVSKWESLTEQESNEQSEEQQELQEQQDLQESLEEQQEEQGQQVSIWESLTEQESHEQSEEQQELLEQQDLQESLEEQQAQLVLDLRITIINVSQPIIININCNIETAKLLDLQKQVNQFLSLRPQIFMNIISELTEVDMFINGIQFDGLDNLNLPLSALNVTSQSNIEAKVRYFLGYVIYNFYIKKIEQYFQYLKLEEGVKLQDIAKFAFENEYTQSMNIGIYSKETEYYTENLEEQIEFIGSGINDMYWIIQGDEKDQYQNSKIDQIVYTIHVKRTEQTFQLQLDGCLQLQDIADYLLEIQEIDSTNIGIFSQNKEYYTEQQQEQLQTIGTGSEDTYLILQGEEKNIYKKKNSLQQITLGEQSNLVINLTGLVQGQMSESPIVLIKDLINEIQTKYQVQNFQLILNENELDIDLNSEEFRMQTIQQVGIINGQSLQVIQVQQQQQQQQQQEKQLIVTIIDGPNYKIITMPCCFQQVTLKDIKLKIQMHLQNQHQNGFVDIFINNMPFTDEDSLNKPLSEVDAQYSQIEARIRKGFQEQIKLHIFINFTKNQQQQQDTIQINAVMKINELVSKIKINYNIQNISLIVKQNGVDIELNTQEYQNKTLQQVAINDCEVLTVQEKQNRIDLIIKYKEKGVSLQMLIGDLVSQIQNKLHIQNISLFVNQNGQDIDLNSQQYQMQTLQQAGIQDQQTITIYDNFEQELKIYILYGPEPIILNHKCYLQKTTIQDLKLKVEQHLSLSPQITTVEISINGIKYTDQEQKSLSTLEIAETNKIVARIKYKAFD